MGRLIANLEAESELAAAETGSTRRTPRRAALVQATGNGSLLRILARHGDCLHLPLSIDCIGADDLDEWLPLLGMDGDRAPRVPLTCFESGPPDELPTTDRVLAWCETPSVARHRRRATPEPDPPHPAGLDGPLRNVLWALPAADPAVVARVHHRGWCLALARELDLALPGATRLQSSTELEAHLKEGGATVSPTGSWVLKAPLSAAGRDRFVGTGRVLGVGKPRATVERLFERHGELLFEPWLERVEDLGVAALVGPAGEVRVVGAHHQRIDDHGRFEAIDPTPPDDATRDRLTETTHRVAAALHAAGYVGPFGIDAFRHRDKNGRSTLHPLGEVNARMTMGLLAHAWREAGLSTFR